MNNQTIARAIRFAMSRVTGDAGWPVVGMLGNALAFSVLGEKSNAFWSYHHARRYLKDIIQKGQFKPKA